MKQFADLLYDLDQTNKTNEKVRLLKKYLFNAPDEDKLWALALFTGKRPKRPVNTTKLREWANELSGIPMWLFNESYSVVGDLSETITLLLPDPEHRQNKSLTFWINYLRSIEPLSDEEKKEKVTAAWQQMTQQERFAFNKLVTGSFRIGVSQKLMTRAIAQVYDIEEAKVAHRLMGHWHPDTHAFQSLIIEENEKDDLSKPYPFFLAYAIEDTADELGNPDEWLAEWKWDGIRSQLIKRGGELYLWSRGEELVTDKFPELMILRDALPDGSVIDGELVVFSDGQVQPFNSLQTRIGRKNITKKHLENSPVAILAYDLMEWEGQDIRELPFNNRRQLLEELVKEVNNSKLLFSEDVPFENWEELAKLRQKSREYFAEGFMLKHKDSPYRVGRKKGDWWKWKIDPLTIDGVLIYAQRGHGRRANLYTDFTFGVWDGEQLVPFTKAYSGMTDEEFREINNFIRKNTIERFGPVRTVEPVQVFEIGFEGIAKSSRHKSGVALRFPRMLRWRKDKPASEANSLADLQELLRNYEEGNL